MLLFLILAIDRNLQRLKKMLLWKQQEHRAAYISSRVCQLHFLLTHLSFYVITYFTSLFRTRKGALCRLTVTPCLNLIQVLCL